MSQAIFGGPRGDLVPEGAHLATHLVPVYNGRLLAFDITAKAARGRWLPWTTLEYGGNPYEVASALADEWCEGAMSDLRLVDVMSFNLPTESWELAIIFRVQLTAKPAGDGQRIPYLYGEGQFDSIGRFDPVDLERWLAMGPTPGLPPPASKPGGLVF